MRKTATQATVTDAASTAENVTVINFGAAEGTDKVRREWLTEREVEALCDAARKRGRYGFRDSTMILVAYRHGLRLGACQHGVAPAGSRCRAAACAPPQAR